MFKIVFYMVTMCILLSACIYAESSHNVPAVLYSPETNSSTDGSPICMYEDRILPSEQDIAEFIIANYPQIFIPQDRRRRLYELFPDDLIATEPYGISGLVATDFEIYDFNNDGNLILVVNFSIPETGHQGHAAFKFINGNFKNVETFDFWSYRFYFDSSGNVILAENHLDNFHRFYYLDVEGDNFEKTLFAHVEGMHDIFNDIVFEGDEMLRFFDERFEGWELIPSLPTENMREIILSSPEIMAWVDFGNNEM